MLQTVFDQKWQAVVALEMDNAYMKQFKKEEDAIDYATGTLYWCLRRACPGWRHWLVGCCAKSCSETAVRRSRWRSGTLTCPSCNLPCADLIGYADVVYSREIQVDLVIGEPPGLVCSCLACQPAPATCHKLMGLMVAACVA